MPISEIEDRLIELHPDRDDLEKYAAYAYLFGTDVEALSDWENEADDAYQGEYASDQDFAQELAAVLSLADDDVQWPYTCIDWKHAARELMMDYSEEGGHYFRQ